MPRSCERERERAFRNLDRSFVARRSINNCVLLNSSGMIRGGNDLWNALDSKDLRVSRNDACVLFNLIE